MARYSIFEIQLFLLELEALIRSIEESGFVSVVASFSLNALFFTKRIFMAYRVLPFDLCAIIFYPEKTYNMQHE